MEARVVKEIQNHLCKTLEQYLEPLGYTLSKKDWDFTCESIVLPFFAMSTRGPYFVISPSILFKNSSIIKEINSLVKRPILVSGRFIFSNRLTRLFRGYSIDDFIKQEKVTETGGSYSWRIFNSEDTSWITEWYTAYMEAVGWRLIENLENDAITYNFYKEVFINWTNDDPELNIFDRSYALDMGAHATMIYLGLRDRQVGISKLIELTREHLPNSLHLIRTEEMLSHFNYK